MRILFINTTDRSGGAAVIIQRLMKGLEQVHHSKNLLLVKTKNGTDAGTNEILQNYSHVISEKIIDRVTRPVGLLYQFFPFSSKNILQAAKTFQPDIINLHNTHGAYFATPLIEKLSRVAPIVWTLHDMWSFTANASHTFENMSWKNLRNDRELTKIPPTIGINTGTYLLKQKKRIYHNSDLTIVTPSVWLQRLAIQSPVFNEKNIFQIYNGVDSSIFKPGNKWEARQKLNLPGQRKTIMFSSHFLRKNNPWKGGADLIEILRLINKSTTQKLTFLALGEGRLDDLDEFSNLDIQYRGYVHSEAEMRDCFNATDLFIYPTRADNLPNVLVESIACGVPCVTFDIGGNKEIVEHEHNGIVIEPFNFNSFAKNTLSLLESEKRLVEFSNNCASVVQSKFRLESMIDNYYSLFQKITQAKG